MSKLKDAPAPEPTKADPVAERAAFDKAMEKVDEAREVEAPAPVEDTRVPPEEVWKESAPKKAAKEERDEAPAEPEIARDDSGRFKAKDEPKEEQPEADEDEVERARNALMRSGFRAKELSTMPRDELLKRGLKRAKALEADDEAHLVAKEYRSRNGESLSKSDKASEARSTEPARPAIDLKGISKPLLDKGFVDEQGASALDEVLKTVAERAQEPLLNRVAELESRLRSSDETQEATFLEGARKELVGRIPGLAEPETLSRVVEVMQSLSSQKTLQDRYRQMPSVQDRYVTAMEDSANILRLERDEDGAAERQSVDADRARRRSGRSTVNDRSRPAPTNARDAERARFDNIMDRLETG
jgi:hypothetical protein